MSSREIFFDLFDSTVHAGERINFTKTTQGKIAAYLTVYQGGSFTYEELMHIGGIADKQVLNVYITNLRNFGFPIQFDKTSRVFTVPSPVQPLFYKEPITFDNAKTGPTIALDAAERRITHRFGYEGESYRYSEQLTDSTFYLLGLLVQSSIGMILAEDFNMIARERIGGTSTQINRRSTNALRDAKEKFGGVYIAEERLTYTNLGWGKSKIIGLENNKEVVLQAFGHSIRST